MLKLTFVKKHKIYLRFSKISTRISTVCFKNKSNFISEVRKEFVSMHLVKINFLNLIKPKAPHIYIPERVSTEVDLPLLCKNTLLLC